LIESNGINKCNGKQQGTERERDMHLSCTVQNGPLKNVYVQLRNLNFRSGRRLNPDVDENR
ncbi:MAG TPA: OprD family outer membrane porin, partial [Thiopseudomonas sp.]|nr:OprD family outer membrane porin [Thiopseudomonas sp.]